MEVSYRPHTGRRTDGRRALNCPRRPGAGRAPRQWRMLASPSPVLVAPKMVKSTIMIVALL